MKLTPMSAPFFEVLEQHTAAERDDLFAIPIIRDALAGTITAAIENDPDTDVNRRAVFALSQLPKDAGVPLMIDVARKNKNPAVRKQAMFWLGQSGDRRALRFFEEILQQ